MKPRAILAVPIADDLIIELANHCELIEPPGAGWTRETVLEALPLAEGVLTNGTVRVDREWLDRGQRLRVVSNRGAGVDNVDVEYASSKGIVICNTPRVLSGALADIVFALILLSSRKLVGAQAHLRSGAWLDGKPAPVGNDIRGKVLGILGLGDIGRKVARTAAGFELTVLYHQPRRVFEAEEDGSVEYVSRDELFRRSDFLSVHCPLTPITEHSIGAAEFGLMKPTAYFINTSRGKVVDEPALIDALKRHVIAGAGLDVMDSEPLSPHSELATLSNAVLLPHVGSLTVETRRAMEELAARNLVDVLTGSAPAAVVNPAVLPPRRDESNPPQI